MAKFLSNDWFNLLVKLNNEHNELNLPPTLQSLVVNFDIKDGAKLYLKEGKLWQGQQETAKSTIILDKETLIQLINTKEQAIALEAFMTGKIRVEGDMSALLSLQSTKPTPEQKALYKAILAMSEF